MPNQRRAGMASIHIYIPYTLREQVQARTQERGETLTDVIVRALRRYAGPQKPN